VRVHLLGTAAGGAFPQWNCNCANCRSVRAGARPARPRLQSCVAVSAAGQRWFLLNASPDLRLQIESFAPLRPQPDQVRGSGVEGILLTNADLDHILGLWLLREGPRLCIHATATVRQALAEGLALDAALARYCGVDWREPPTALAPLLHGDGTPSGLHYAALLVPGKPPRYREEQVTAAPGDTVGYHLVDAATGGRLLFMPDVAALDETLLAQMADCDTLLLDGTFWCEDEMERMGVGTTSAAAMGHLPVGGDKGSLARIADLPIARKIYVHINNTNPMLLEDSPERAMVEAAGVEIGWDGLEFTL
jgi:pyrroloquinoline quinone biosynthesis protein B